MPSNNPFYVQPGGDYSRGLAGLTQQLQQIGAQRKEDEIQQNSKKRFEGFQAAYAKAKESNSPEAWADAAIEYPEMSEAIFASQGIYEKADADRANNFMRELLTAGTDEERDAIFKRRIEESQSMGKDVTQSASSYLDWTKNPASEMREIENLYATTDPAGYKALVEERRGDIKGQELDIKRETLQLRREENAARRDEQKLARETNELKRDELRVKIDERKNKIADSKKKVTEAATAAYDSVDRSVDTVNRLLNHPGLEAAVGTSSVIPSIPGTDRADFEAELESFDAQIFSNAVKQMKGLGSLSEAEGRKISAAAGAINPKMSEEAFKRSLRIIKDGFEKAKQNLESQGVVKPKEEPATQMSIDDLVNKYAQ